MSQKKKILVLTPDTPDPSYIESIVNSLAFLQNKYLVHPLDSLSIMEDLPNAVFYQQWQKKLAPYLLDYDVFFGFSFGGVILQQCFSLFANPNKPLILISAPTIADHSLKQKLGAVISLCEQQRVDEAMHLLYQHVYYPNPIPTAIHKILDYKTAAQRVIYGLNRVLTTDSSDIIANSSVVHLHLIGELSDLVNKNNVLPAKNGTLVSVPNAGMRIFRDQPAFCQQVILEFLNNEC